MPSFQYHFKFRPGVNRMFIWSNRVRNIYLIILIACIYFFFRLPLVNKYSNELIESSLSNNNGLSIIYNLFEQASIRRCSTSSLISADNIHSHTRTSQLIILLYFGAILLSGLAQWLYSNVSRDQLVKPYRGFCWCRNIVICLACTSICNQLVNTLSCRPIDILYDVRFVSMLIVQMIGFFLCLLFAFFLGVKYASIKVKN